MTIFLIWKVKKKIAVENLSADGKIVFTLANIILLIYRFYAYFCLRLIEIIKTISTFSMLNQIKKTSFSKIFFGKIKIKQLKIFSTFFNSRNVSINYVQFMFQNFVNLNHTKMFFLLIEKSKLQASLHLITLRSWSGKTIRFY